MSLDVFDDPELDRALASGLSALAPEVEAVELTLADLRPRFHRARTRRRVVRASAGVAALLLIGSVAIAEAPSVRHAHVTVESPARRTETTTLPKRTSTTVRHHPSTTTTPTTVPLPKPSAAPTSGVSVSPSWPPTPTVAPVPATAASTVPATVPPRTNPSTSPAARPVAKPRWYSSSAGRILVRLEGGDRMVLVQVSPDTGYRARVNAEMRSYISVSFRRHDRTESRIVLTLRDGHIVQSGGADGASYSGGDSHVSSASGHGSGHHDGASDTKVSPPAPGSEGAPVSDTPSNPDAPAPDNSSAPPVSGDTNV